MIYVVPNIPEPLSRAICADLIANPPPPADDTPEEPEPPPCQPGAAPEPQAPARPTFEDMTPAMPPGAKFPPPDRGIISEIVTSNSPVFLDLDPMLPAGYATESATLSHATVS